MNTQHKHLSLPFALIATFKLTKFGSSSDVHWRRLYFQLTCVHSAL